MSACIHIQERFGHMKWNKELFNDTTLSFFFFLFLFFLTCLTASHVCHPCVPKPGLPLHAYIPIWLFPLFSTDIALAWPINSGMRIITSVRLCSLRL
jgi:hypothetical protein